MEDVGVLGGGVIAPHGDPADLVDARAGASGQLGDGAIVVEAGQGGEPVGRDLGSVGGGDRGVGVGGVADDDHPDVIGGNVVDDRALGGEDVGVGGQQVGALHALGARTGPDEQTETRPVERLARIVEDVDGLQEGERAVVEFHRGAHCAGDRLRQLEKAQGDGLILAEHRPGGDPEDAGVPDAAGRAGHGHGDRSAVHEGFSVSRTCAAGPTRTSAWPTEYQVNGSLVNAVTQASAPACGPGQAIIVEAREPRRNSESSTRRSPMCRLQPADSAIRLAAGKLTSSGPPPGICSPVTAVEV